MKNEITVVYVDDHAMICEAARSQIDAVPGMRFVAFGQVGDDVLPLVMKHKPDVLFLDVHMPQSREEDGKTFRIMPAIQAIKEISPKTAVVIVSMDVSHILFDNAFRRGISGYLLKGDNAATLHLADVVRAVNNGTPYFSEAVLARMQANENQDILTKRQLEIMIRIAADPGRSIAALAADMGITEGTLRNHQVDIRQRLGASTPVECYKKCLILGLISLDD